MGKAYLLDELEFGMLRQHGHGLGDAEHGADYVMRRVAQVPGVVSTTPSSQY